MINLTAILNHIVYLIDYIKRYGEYESDIQNEEWQLGDMWYCDNIFMGESLEINGVQVWNNW